ncbi:hypothetical protein AAF712_014453 [Marasmius tenuissimus]|uniref:Uncharacterized protein n=1 Tax=Marasmius tenuissimus TaxID=585030 RepID=A0ABR2ZCA3_9AGAR
MEGRDNGQKYSPTTEAWFDDQVLPARLSPLSDDSPNDEGWIDMQLLGDDWDEDEIVRKASMEAVRCLRGGAKGDSSRNSKKLKKPKNIPIMIPDASGSGSLEGDSDSEEDPHENDSEHTRWLVNEGKKRNYNLKSGESLVIMFMLHQVCKERLEEGSFLEDTVRYIEGSLCEGSREGASLSATCDKATRREKDNKSKTDVFREYNIQEKAGITKKTFMSWLNHASTFSELAAAGSIYLLLLIASANLRPCFKSLVIADILVLCLALLRPDDGGSPLGKVAKEVLIPAICDLRQRVSFTWKLPERDWKAWKGFELLQPFPPPNAYVLHSHSITPMYKRPADQPHSPPDQLPDIRVVSIKTLFDPESPQNKMFPCIKDMESRMAWTLERRETMPKVCVRPTTLDDSSDKVTDNLRAGYRKNKDLYIYYDREQMDDIVFNIIDKNGKIVTSFGNTVPQRTMHGTFPTFQGLYPELEYINSSKIPRQKFGCSHLNIWNRYTTLGKDAPHDAHPFSLEREGTSRPCDPSQFAPRHSKETYKQEPRSTILLNVMQPIVQHLATVMEEHFPDETKELEAFVHKLEYDGVSEVHPFAGVAVNVNVATIAHLDPMDLYLCLVLALHECTGGEIILEELGIVIDLKPGDFVIFPSTYITHYNLNFKGRRASFAFSTDKRGMAWAKTNNNWDENDYMKSSTRRIT